MTTVEAAQVLGVSKRRVVALIEAGKIKARKHGQAWLVLSIEGALIRKPGRPRETQGGS